MSEKIGLQLTIDGCTSRVIDLFVGDSAQLAEKQNHRKIIVVLDNAHFTMYKSSARLVVDRMEELIVELLLVENVWCQKQSWSFMNLLCSGMVGFGLRRNLGTTEKEHPSPTLHPPMLGEVLALFISESERNHLLAV